MRVWDITSEKEIIAPWHSTYAGSDPLKAIVHGWNKIGKEISFHSDSLFFDGSDEIIRILDGPNGQRIVTLYNPKMIRNYEPCGEREWSMTCLVKRYANMRKDVFEVLPHAKSESIRQIEVSVKKSEMTVKDLASGLLVLKLQHNDRREQYPHWTTLSDSVRERFLTIESNASGEAIGRIWRLPPWSNIEEMIAHAKKIVRPDLSEFEKSRFSMED